MAQTSREIVQRCLRFEYPERMPRELWALPWAFMHYPREMEALTVRYPGDFEGTGLPPELAPPPPCVQGDPYGVGRYTDEWGCIFTNVQPGVIGEVKEPLIADISEWRRVQPPYESLPTNLNAARDVINRQCAATDHYMRAGCNARPWERYQFIRGSANAMMDLMDPEEGFTDLLKVIHEFYIKEMEFWVTTDVDGIGFMDDWGSQRELLISPVAWREFFKPLYKDYCDLAHAHGKDAWMHSDGHIASIYPDLVEVGVNALNSQLFVMDMDDLARKAKGKLTFWGEIDRQHVLPSTDPQVGRNAVREVAAHLYSPQGGIIAQFEFTAGSNPTTAFAIFDEWDRVQAEIRNPVDEIA